MQHVLCNKLNEAGASVNANCRKLQGLPWLRSVTRPIIVSWKAYRDWEAKHDQLS